MVPLGGGKGTRKKVATSRITLGLFPLPSILTACSSVVSGIQTSKATGRRRIRCRWQLLYTLVNNPSLLGSRKHFQTLQTSESILNGTPNPAQSKKEAAEAAELTGTPSTQERGEGDP